MTWLGDCAGGDGGKRQSTAAFLHFFLIFTEALCPQTTLYTNGATLYTQREYVNKSPADSEGIFSIARN